MKKIFFNPFEQFSERTLLLFGITATIVLSSTAAYFNARFDGVLDLHFSTPTYFSDTLLDNTVNVVVLTLTLFILGKTRNKKTRFIDVFSASIIARIPYYFLPFFNWNNVILKESDTLMKQFLEAKPEKVPELENVNMILLVLFTGVSMLLLAWFLYLLYQGYKTATNAKSGVEIVLFGVTIIGAEIISKIIFYLIN